jgi:pimeloyl-ACP methyl ester carboxylesterase
MEAILEEFCTPPPVVESETDLRALEGAVQGAVHFEDRTLVTCTWGEGPTVLLAHGWGSRASHMALIARGLARGGYRAVAFDAPAHGRTRAAGGSPLSNGFEFGRAIRAVADAAGPVTAVVGHSLGAASAAFAAAGLGVMKPSRIDIAKLVFISAPAGIDQLMESWCQKRGDPVAPLKRALDREFACRTEDYTMVAALPFITGKVLLIHDEDDEEIPVATARDASRASPAAKLVLTKGLGHGRILAGREALRSILAFLVS